MGVSLSTLHPLHRTYPSPFPGMRACACSTIRPESPVSSGTATRRHTHAGPVLTSSLNLGLAILLVCMVSVGDAGTDVVISEFMADNDSTIIDGDGNASDWIELHNTSSNAVDLAGWYLGDDTNDLQQWQFPPTNIPGGAFLVVFASGQEETNYVDSLGYLHTTFKLSRNDNDQHESVMLVRNDGVTVAHAYLDYPEQHEDITYGMAQEMAFSSLVTPGIDATALIPTGPVADWTTTTYDDSSWPLTGATGVGYDNGPDYKPHINLDVADMRTRNGSVYIRIEFEVADASVVELLELRMKYDDGFAAHLNGTPVVATNAPLVPQWDSQATASHEADLDDYENFDITGTVGALVTGTNVLAIQGFNTPVHGSDMLILPELIAAAVGEIQTNSALYLVSPTPGENNETGVLGYVADTKFSVNRGFYTNSFQVAITTATENAEIYYSLDGNVPDAGTGNLYSGPIPISGTTILRAAAYRPGYAPSDVDTHTYIFISDVLTQPASAPGPEWPSGPVNGQVFDYAMDPNVVSDARYTDLMDDALLDIPSISLVTAPDNLFDPSSGIYVNPRMSGRTWERAASVELVNPDGSEGFQVSAGLRIRGGSSTAPANPKHSFRLLFRSEYGDAKLNYPLFEDEGVKTFDRMDLRTGQNFSWNVQNRGQYATWLYDIFTRDTHRDMEQPYSRGRYYHLFLNGCYWGLYQTDERPEANYGESYFGDDDEDYDIVKSTDAQVVEAIDGTLDSYYSLWTEINAGMSDNADYYRIQGFNPDGTRNPGYTRLLDVENLIDYMILVFYTADRDRPLGPPHSAGQPRNLYTIFSRSNPDGFQFIAHDAEHSMEIEQGVYHDRVSMSLRSQLGNQDRCNPWWMHLQLMANGEYSLAFADHVHRHFFNDGVLTPAAATNRFLVRAAEMDLAVIAESARWGDFQTSPARTKDDDWLPAVSTLVNDYMKHSPDTRTDIVLDQFKTQGWYPNTDAPQFSQHGGVFAAGFQLGMSASHPVYYTLDGTDPREIGTGNPAGTLFTNAIELPSSINVKARARNGSAWSALAEAVFVLDEPTPPLRVTEIMYHPADPDSTETTYATSDFDFIELMNAGTQTIGLAGIEFTDGIAFDFTEGDVSSLGPGEYVVIVNSFFAFTNRYPDWSSVNIAGEFHGRFSLPGALDNGGENIVLADGLGNTIQAFEYDDDWYPITDGDGFSLTLINAYGDTNGWSNENAWRASAHVNGTPGEGPVDSPSPGDLVINEILSHQDEDNPGDWVELYNASTNTIDINGWYLSDDEDNLAKVRVTNIAEVPPGGYLVLTEYAHFGTDAVGTNGFAISELGDAIYLSSASNGGLTGYREEQEFDAAERNVTFGRYAKSNGDVDFTAMSSQSSGASNAYPKVGPIVISEIMYHPQDSNSFEFVELYNTASSNVTIYDSAHPSNTWRLTGAIEFAFPTNVVMPANGYLLVVPTNEAVFTSMYDILPGTPVYGPYDGKLDNAGENLRLQKPTEPEQLTGETPYVLVERVEYDNEEPWPLAADGTGASLERLDASLYGNDSTSWVPSFHDPTPGLPYADIDLDGMPDWWETRHFGGTNVAHGGALEDSDGDGSANLAEWLAGTDPTDLASVFRIISVDADPDGLRVSWSSVTGKSYSVSESTDLLAPWPTPPLTNGIAGEASGTTQLVAPLTASPPAFYRIDVEGR